MSTTVRFEYNRLYELNVDLNLDEPTAIPLSPFVPDENIDASSLEISGTATLVEQLDVNGQPLDPVNVVLADPLPLAPDNETLFATVEVDSAMLQSDPPGEPAASFVVINMSLRVTFDLIAPPDGSGDLAAFFTLPVAATPPHNRLGTPFATHLLISGDLVADANETTGLLLEFEYCPDDARAPAIPIIPPIFPKLLDTEITIPVNIVTPGPNPATLVTALLSVTVAFATP